MIEDFEIEHSASGWLKFRERLNGSIPFAVETSQGVAVEQLLEAGMKVYPLESQERSGLPATQSAQRSQRRPARCLEFCGRLPRRWPGLESPAAAGSLIKELRALCRDEVGQIEQRTAFINQLRSALAEYYPTALEAFEDWGSISAWMFVQRFPTAQALEQAGKRRWEKFLHSRHLWRTQSGLRRMELFAHATEFCASTPIANAKSQLALSLINMLFVLEKQLALYRQRIEELFARHPDHDLFGSLPAPDPRLLRGCFPKSVMIAIASAASPKPCNAWQAPLQ